MCKCNTKIQHVGIEWSLGRDGPVLDPVFFSPLLRQHGQPGWDPGLKACYAGCSPRGAYLGSHSGMGRSQLGLPAEVLRAKAKAILPTFAPDCHPTQWLRSSQDGLGYLSHLQMSYFPSSEPKDNRIQEHRVSWVGARLHTLVQGSAHKAWQGHRNPLSCQLSLPGMCPPSCVDTVPARSM